MSTSRLLGSFGVGVATGVVCGATGAGLFAAAGATGAAIMTSAGYAGFSVVGATKMGAVGGAILGGGTGFIRGSLGLFSRNPATSVTGEVASFTAGAVLGGLIGFGVLQSAIGLTAMTIGATAAAFAVGASVIAIPAAIALAALMTVIVVVAAACIANYEPANEPRYQRV
jgi:hypothetical protein